MENIYQQKSLNHYIELAKNYKAPSKNERVAIEDTVLEYREAMRSLDEELAEEIIEKVRDTSASVVLASKSEERSVRKYIEKELFRDFFEIIKKGIDDALYNRKKNRVQSD